MENVPKPSAAEGEVLKIKAIQAEESEWLWRKNGERKWDRSNLQTNFAVMLSSRAWARLDNVTALTKMQ